MKKIDTITVTRSEGLINQATSLERRKIVSTQEAALRTGFLLKAKTVRPGDRGRNKS
jgi:hypothetical protein